MTDLIEAWERPYFRPGGGIAFVYFVVYGEVEIEGGGIDPRTYRCAGLPDGVEVERYNTQSFPGVVEGFKRGYPWEELQRRDPGLAAEIDQREECLVVRAEIPDPSDLNYLRDIVGLLAYCGDHGAIGFYDPQVFQWWSPDDWRRVIFGPSQPVPCNHTVLLVSLEEGGTEWLHTRGMRKFGRPDLSVRGVSAPYREAVLAVCNRLVEFLALGGVIEDGLAFSAQGLPDGMRCVHGGHLEDPDFHNVHLEVQWPGEEEGAEGDSGEGRGDPAGV